MTEGRPALEATGVKKSFAGVVALNSLGLTVGPGEVHALVGENGSGKSTFIKILSGYHHPDAGSAVWIAGEPMTFGSPGSAYAHGCRFVHQDLGLIDSSSVLDNLCMNAGFPSRLLTIRQREALRQAQSDLAQVGLDIDPHTVVSDLTPAMKTGGAVARALRADTSTQVRLLVLDEPTATLPHDEVRHLLEIVRQVASRGVGVLYVTHRLDEVFDVANRVTVLRDGHAAATEPIAALDRPRLISLMIGSELDEIQAAAEHVVADSGGPVLEISGLHAAPVRDVSFTVAPGDVVGIAGITGSGRETILGAIYGATARQTGNVTIKGTVLRHLRPDRAMSMGMAYLPADRKGLGGIMEFSARENLCLSDLKPFWHGLRLRRGQERIETLKWFARLSVRPRGAVEQRLTSFSGGNQQKLLFGKWLRRRPDILLLDEPTQGVDIGAKAELHRQLLQVAKDGAGVLVSSSDADELAALCRRVIVLRDGKIVSHLSGPRLTVANIARESLGSHRGVMA